MASKKVGGIHLFSAAVGLMVGFIILGGYIGYRSRSTPAAIYISPPAPTDVPPATATAEPLTVFVSGQVNKPGVYEFPQGSIVQEAIEGAGGFAPGADMVQVNLAYPLNNGLHIHVPEVDQDNEIPVFSGETHTSDNGASKININIAGAEELDTLPGIGPVTAAKIIAHREVNGLFGSAADIMDVDGIGPGKFDDIKDLISTD